jgi:hypothetical protein
MLAGPPKEVPFGGFLLPFFGGYKRRCDMFEATYVVKRYVFFSYSGNSSAFSTLGGGVYV